MTRTARTIAPSGPRLSTPVRSGDAGPEGVIAAILGLVHDLLGVGAALVTRTDGNAWRVSHLDDAAAPFAAGSPPPRDTCCHHVVGSVVPVPIAGGASGREGCARSVAAALGTGASVRVPLLLRDGERVGFLCLLGEADGSLGGDAAEVLRVLAGLVARELDNQRRLSVAHDAGEARYRAVVESAADAIVTADAAGRIVTWNRGAETMFGYRAEEVVGRPATILMPDRFRPAHDAALARLRAGGRPHLLGQTIEVAGERRGGEEFPLELSLAGWESDGEPMFTAILRDATARTRAEQALRAAETKYRSLVEHLPVVTYVETCVPVEDRTATRYISPQVEALLGRNPDEILADPDWWEDALHPDDRARVRAEADRARAAGGPYAVEYRMIARDGRTVWVQDTATLVRDAAETPLYWQGVLADVTAQKAAEAERRELQRFNQGVIEAMPSVVYVFDLADGRNRYVNQRVREVLGYDTGELRTAMADGLSALMHPDDAARLPAHFACLASADGEACEFEYRMRHRDGSWRRFLSRDIVFARAGNGTPTQILGVAQDVTTQRTVEERLRQSEARFRSLVQNSADVVTILAADGTICYESPAAGRVLGYRPDELVGRDAFALVHPDDVDAVRGYFAAVLRQPGVDVPAEFRVRHQDGSWRWLEAVATNLLADPSVAGVVVNSRDVTERKGAEERLAHLAFHDPLTGLPNRALFMARLDRAIAAEGGVAVLFLDLDGFKTVNDSLGHAAGDELLAAVGRRFAAALGPNDLVARFGGDEFAILLPGIGDAASAQPAAEGLIAAFRSSFTVAGQDAFLGATVGIALGGPDLRQPDDLVRAADTALYRAKERGRGGYALFEPGMTDEAVIRLRLLSELRQGIDGGEFRLAFQPIVELSDGRVREVEALLRWAHPTRGAVPPSDFVPLAEETGLIVPLGGWVLAEACRQAVSWQAPSPGVPAPAVCVNLSARQFREPTLVAEVASALRASGLPPERLTLEVTETTAMADEEASVATLRALKGLGVGLAIDDFGTGYSGLSALKRYPVDVLKIDRSFVAGLGRDPEDEAIVRAVVAIARAMGLGVTAEGVETVDQLVALLALGCDRGQGYQFSQPLPAEAVPGFLGGVSRSTDEWRTQLEGVADPARLSALRRLNLLDTPPEAAFDALTRLATRLLGVPVSLVSLVDEDRQFFKSAVGLPEPWASTRETPLSHSFCQRVVAGRGPLVVEDARRDPRLAGNLAIPDLGVVAYAGVPLATADGHVLGSFCAIDAKPRAWSAEDLAVLEDLASTASALIELRTTQALFRGFMEFSPTVAFVKDGAGRYAYLNATMEQLFGLDAVEQTGRTDADFLPRPVAEAVRTNDRRVLATWSPTQLIEEVPTPDGRRRHWLTTKFPFRNANGDEFVGGVAIDVTDREEARRALDEAKEAAEAANRLKGDFLANLSHALRTPMAAVQGGVDLLLAGAAGELDPRRADILAIIRRNAEQQMAIVDDLLRLGALGAEEVGMAPRSVAVGEALDQIPAALASEAATKGRRSP